MGNDRNRGEVALFALLMLGAIVVGTVAMSVASRSVKQNLQSRAEGAFVCSSQTVPPCVSNYDGSAKFCFNECIPGDTGYSRRISCKRPSSINPDPWIKEGRNPDCTCSSDPSSCFSLTGVPTLRPTVTLIPTYTPTPGQGYLSPTPTLFPTVTLIPSSGPATPTLIPYPKPTLDPIACIGGGEPCKGDVSAVYECGNDGYIHRLEETCKITCLGPPGLQSCTFLPGVEFPQYSCDGVTPPTLFDCPRATPASGSKPTVTRIPTYTPPVSTVTRTSMPSPTPAYLPVLPVDVSTHTPFRVRTYYNQCAEPWRNQTYGACTTVCKMGCGPTSMSMILDTLLAEQSTSYPPNVTWSEFASYPSKIYCNGSPRHDGIVGVDPEDLVYSFTDDYGLLSDLIPFPVEPASIATNRIELESYVQQPEIQKKYKELIVNYINSGWAVIANTMQSQGDHFVVISSIEPDGRVMVYDPYPFNGAVQGLGALSRLGQKDGGVFIYGIVIVKN